MEATKEDLIDLLVRTKRWMEELDAIGITNDDLYTDIENTLTGDWRLPTKEELVSLYRHGYGFDVDVGYYNVWFWSSTLSPSNSNSAMVVDLYTGFVNAVSRSQEHKVHLVRTNGHSLEWSMRFEDMNWYDAMQLPEIFNGDAYFTSGKVYFTQEVCK